jgi:hypothetical protein
MLAHDRLCESFLLVSALLKFCEQPSFVHHR